MERPLVVDKVLLVEGPDDRFVIDNLCKAARLADLGFTIKPKQGFPNLRRTLDTELDASGLQALGIVVDADTDLENRWASLRHRLQRRGYSPLPQQPAGMGLVVTAADLPRVGVWLMPNNQLPGMLEDFVAYLVPEGDRLWPRALDCVAQIPEADRRFSPAHLSKAHIHTWLAWQKKPGSPLGQSITERSLGRVDGPEARQFLAWLRRLFAV